MGPVLPQNEWAVNVSEGEVARLFGEWGADVQIMIRHINFPLKWSIHVVHPPLATFAKDCVVLAGDSVSFHLLVTPYSI